MQNQPTTALGVLGGAALALMASTAWHTPAPAAQDLAFDVRQPSALSSPEPGKTALLAFDPGPSASALRRSLANSMAPLVELADTLDLPLFSVHPSEEVKDPAQNPLLAMLPERQRFEREGPNALGARGLERALDAKDVVALGSLHDGAFVVSLLALLRGQSSRVYFIADLAGDEPDAGWFLSLERVVSAGAVPMSMEHFVVDLVENWSSADGAAVRELLDEGQDEE